MAIPQKFNSQPTTIATYDYTDLAEGTGIVKYYLYQEEDSVGVSYRIGSNALYSANIEVSGNLTAGASFVQASDLDFDLTSYNRPQTIRGTASVQASIMAKCNGPEDSYVYLILKLRKWDGSTETEIASATTPTANGTDSSNPGKILLNSEIVVPRTHFKVGDILRLTIEVWARVNPGGSGKWIYATDPQNRDGTYLTPSTDDTITRFELYIPYELDV